MAATVTAKSGHHIAYYRQQAAAGNERSPLSYYSAGAKQGGAEGRWFGRALPALGLHEGQAVDMEDNGPYTQVYNQTNPLTGERLSRAPQSATSSRSPAAPSTGGAPPEQVRNADGSAATARSAVAAAGSKPGPKLESRASHDRHQLRRQVLENRNPCRGEEDHLPRPLVGRPAALHRELPN